MSNDANRYSLALDEARRSLDRQAGDVASLRERTTSLVSIGGLAAAFIGGLAVRDDATLSGWAVLGAASFAALVVVAVVALWPRDYVFTQRGDVLVTWGDRDDVSTGDMDRDLALHMDNHYGTNAVRIKRLNRAYGVALGLLLVEVAALLLDLRGR